MRKNGTALIVVVIIMNVTFFIAAIVVDRSLKSSRRIKETINDTQAYYYAESLIYDMVNYIDIYYIKLNNDSNAVTKGMIVSKSSKPQNFALIGSSDLLKDYTVTLTSDIIKTNSDTEVTYTYNVESIVEYMKRRYKVIVQINSKYTKDTLNFLEHSIIDKRAFKY